MEAGAKTEGVETGGPWRRGRAVVARVVAWVGVLVVLLLAGAIRIGIPGWMADRLLVSVNQGGWYCEASRVTLDPRGGFVAHHLHVFRKGVTGPPCVEAERVGILYDLFGRLRRGQSRVREMSIAHGVVRPWSKGGREGDGGVGGGGISAGGGGGQVGRPTLEMAVRMEDVDLLGVPIMRAQGRMRMDGVVVGFSGMDVEVGDDVHSGTLQGEVVWKADGSVAGRLVTRIDPRTVHPFMRECGWDLSAVLDRFSFHGEPPVIDLTFEVPGATGGVSVVYGHFQASQFAYQGAAVGFANLGWKHEWGGGRHQLMLNPLVLVVGGRSVTGGLTFDLERGWVEGEAVSTVEFPTLSRLIGLPPGWIPETWAVGSQERVYAKGRYAYGDRSQTAMEVAAEGHDLRIGRFHLDEVSLKWLMRGETNEVTDIRGRMADGSFTGAAELVPEAVEAGGMRYRVRGEILNADMSRVLAMVGSGMVTGIEGKVYGNIELAGVTGKAGSGVVGRGEVNIRRGRLFNIPLFGGLTKALTSRFPGVDMLVLQREAHATFEVGGGKVSSHDLRLDGDVFAVEADGGCGLDGVLGFVVKVRPAAEGKVIGSAMRALSFPFSKLLEFKLEGTLSKPEWTSSMLSWSGWKEGDLKKEKESK